MNVRSEDALCGSFHKIEIMFEYYDYDLLKDIAARASTDQYYSAQEMWNISASISEGLAYLQDNRIPHQDVQPENVLLNENGTIKMGDYGLITGGLSGYYKLLSGKTQTAYTSPKLFEQLKKRVFKPRDNPFKSDVYSMGITLLHAGTLRDPQACYDFKTFTMNRTELDNSLAEINRRYGPEYYDFMRLLLTEEEADRPDWLGLRMRKQGYASPSPEHHHQPQPQHQEVNHHQFEPQVIEQDVQGYQPPAEEEF